MQRREFLKTAGCFIVSAAAPSWIGCTNDTGDDAKPGGRFLFPQGVASGDPQTTSVMLWTRVVSGVADGAPIPLTLEVSPTESFERLVVTQKLVAGPASDFTVRILAENLEPNRRYYYRFRAGADTSRVGRTTRTR